MRGVWAACAALAALAAVVTVVSGHIIVVDLGADSMKVALVKPGMPFQVVNNFQSKRKVCMLGPRSAVLGLGALPLRRALPCAVGGAWAGEWGVGLDGEGAGGAGSDRAVDCAPHAGLVRLGRAPTLLCWRVNGLEGVVAGPRVAAVREAPEVTPCRAGCRWGMTWLRECVPPSPAGVRHPRQTPVALTFHDGERLIGADALTIQARKPEYTFVVRGRVTL
jgi:hypothetical protein